MWPKVLRLCTLLSTYTRIHYGHKIIFVRVLSTVSFPAAVIRIRSYYANEDSSHLRCTPIFPKFRTPKIPKIRGSQNSQTAKARAPKIPIFFFTSELTFLSKVPDKG